VWNPKGWARDLLGGFVDRRVDRRVGEDLAAGARFRPVDPTSSVLLTPPMVPTAAQSPKDFPLPPDRMQEEAPDFLGLGERHVDDLRSTLSRVGAAERGNILDFGCGAGRLTRWFLEESRQDEVWGVDFNAEHIMWNQAHLSPPFHFALCTALPSLPFEDRYFGLVLAGSVFTHISEMEQSWLLELRRITRPGGHLYLTVQDAPFIERMGAAHASLWITQMIHDNEALLARLGRDADTISIGRHGNDAMVFHDRDALVRRWSQLFEVLDVVDGAFYEQSAVVLRRPAV
jgi:SAM-dependent methyltransferase